MSKTSNQMMFAEYGHSPFHINKKIPKIGNKSFLLKTRGMFVLERGPAVLLSLQCTHAGSGGLIAYDGVPDEFGQFDSPPEELFNFDNFTSEEERAQSLLDWEVNKNGREIYCANPAVLQSWQLSAGCEHGLTILSAGEVNNAAPVLTIVWMAHESREEQLKRLAEKKASG